MHINTDPMASPLSVLMLSASPQLSSQIQAALEQWAYEPIVIQVDDPFALQAALDAHWFHIVIADDSIPDFSSLDALRTLRAAEVDIPLITVVDSIDRATYEAALNAGAADALPVNALDRLPMLVSHTLHEASLNKHSTLYHAVFENADDGILLTDVGTMRFLKGNQAIADMLGCTRDEIPSLGVPDIHPADVVEHTKEAFRRLVLGKERVAKDIAVLRRDGTTFYADITSAPLWIDNRLMTFGIFRDVTAYKQAREKLIESEHNFHQLFASNPLPMWVDDLDTLEFLDVNDAAVKHYGYSREEFLRMTIKDIRPPEEIDRLVQNIAAPGEALDQSEGWHHVLKDGTVIDVEITSHTLDYNGHRAALVVAHDVTERKRAEEALRISEERYRSTFEHTAVGIAHTNSEGKWLWVNQTLLDMLGYTWEELQNKTWQDITHPEDLAVNSNERQQLVTGNADRRQVEKRYRRADGTYFWCSLTISAVRNATGDPIYFIGVIADIDERKRASLRLQRAVTRLEGLHRIDNAILGAKSAQDIMDNALAHLQTLIPSEHAVIVSLDFKTKMATVLASQHNDVRAILPGTLLPFENSPDVDNIRQHSYILTRNLEHDPHPYIRQLYQEGIRSIYSARLQCEDHLLGALTLMSSDVDFFTAENISIIREVADQLAIGLNAALLREQIEQYAQALEERVVERTAELENAKTHVEAILNSSSDGILVVDLELGIQQTNAAARTLFACEDCTWLQKPLVELAHPDDQARLQYAAEFAAALNYAVQRIEIRAVRADGTLFDAEIGMAKVQKLNVERQQIVCSIRDITAHKQAQNVIAEERNLLRTLIDSIPDFIYIKDMHHRFTLSNIAHARARGASVPEELIGKTDFDFFPAELAVQLQREEAEMLRAGKSMINVEQRATGARGEIWESDTKVPLRNLSGQTIGLVGITRDISERKQAEISLQGFAAELHDLYNNAPCGYHSLDEHGMIIKINDTELTWLGYTREEVVGKLRFTDLITPADMDTFQKNFPLLKQQGWVRGIEYNMVRKDGTTFPVSLNATVIKDRDGRFLMSRSTTFDISERKQAEAVLRESEERYRSVVSSMSEGIILFGRDGRIEACNPAAEHILGMTVEQMLGRTQVSPHWRTIYEDGSPFPPEKYPAAVALRTGKPRSNVIIGVYKPDGILAWILVNAQPIFNEGESQPVRVVASLADITENIFAEKALMSSEEKYRRLIETMQGGFALFDQNDTVTYVNDRFCTLVGYSRSEVIGMKAHDFVDTSALSELNRQINRRSQGESTTYELVARRKDGQRIYLLISGSPLFDDQGNVIGSSTVCNDITAQKRVEAILQQALEQEKELSELKSRFVSMASHEFRTPLATIRATVETLITYRERMDDSQIDKRLIKITDQVDRMKDIMDDVLQLSRMHAGRVEFAPEEIDLDAFCQDIIDEFQSHPTTRHQLVYTCTPQPLPAYLDPKLMRQVVSNLISNAIKYSPDATVVTITVEDNDTQITLRIQDYGIGIPPEDLKRLFEAFHRASNVGTISGTGLGLSITKQAVEMHSGRIDIESQVGAGSTVIVTIPHHHTEVINHDQNTRD